MKQQLLIASGILAVTICGSWVFSARFGSNTAGGQRHTHASLSLRSLPANGPIVSFNFDDGLRSAYDKAVPIFLKADVPATFYVVSGYFGKKGYISPTDVLELQSEGFEIGAHSRSHRTLGTISGEAELQSEILGSKSDLEHIGVHVSTFAYPEGSFSDRAREIVAKNFAGARITSPLMNDRNTDRFLLRRQRVQADTPLEEVEQSIDFAAAQKKWLIIVFHKIDEDGNSQSVRHETLQQIVDYVKLKSIPVVTNAEGIAMLDRIE